PGEKPLLPVRLPLGPLGLAPGVLFEPPLRAGVAGAAQPARPRGPPAGELAADDGEQPVAERPARRVVLQPRHRPADGEEAVLPDVGGVGVLEALLARVAVRERPVQRDELLPRIAVARVAQPDEQARPGWWDLGHRSSRLALQYGPRPGT